MKPFTPTVVHANDLVNASYNLSINEIRLVLLACSKIDSKGSPLGAIFISVSEYENAFKLNSSNATYANLRNAAKTLIRNPIKLFNSEIQEITELVWLVSNKYTVGESGTGVHIEFSPKITPFLFEIKERFTSIAFEIAARLDTPFSFRLYQWLKEAEHKKENQREHNSIEVILEIDWMKEQAQITGKAYERYFDFDRYVLKPALQRINSMTDLSVFYCPEKTGRKITAIKFTFVQESSPFMFKPIRPRLHRRPKVLRGSHEEGVWMRKNLAILLDYEKALKAYDKCARMDLPDLRKMAEYASICDTFLEERLREEIKERAQKVK